MCRLSLLLLANALAPLDEMEHSPGKGEVAYLGEPSPTDAPSENAEEVNAHVEQEVREHQPLEDDESGAEAEEAEAHPFAHGQLRRQRCQPCELARLVPPSGRCRQRVVWRNR